MTPLLAQRARSRERAFERLYRRHAGDVYRYSLAVLRNPTDAEDVTQTTFLNAYRAFLRGERPEKPQNWLIAIAHNVCRQRFRQTARRPSEVAFNEDSAEAIPLENEGPSAEDLTRALGHLAFNQRSAIVLRELEGRSYAEIAQTLDISVSAVETLLFRARRALREQLEGSLTCREAERAISRQRDGHLPRNERGALRAHLRECRECASFARSQRAQRSAWKGIAAIPLPSSLASFFGGGGGAALTGATTAGVGAAAKTAAVLGAAALAGGIGYEGVKHHPWQTKQTRAVVAAEQTPVPTRRSTPSVSSVSATPVVARSTTAGFAAAAPSKAKPAKVRASGPAAHPARAKKRPAPKPHPRPRPAKPPAAAPEPQAVAPAAQSEAPAAQPEAKPVKVKTKAEGLGLARSERAAREKTKPDRPAVGLAKSEERSKQKARKKAAARPANQGQGSPSAGQKGNGPTKAVAGSPARSPRTTEPRTTEPRTTEPRTTEPRTTEPPPAEAGNGNGNGNGGGNANGGSANGRDR